MATYFLHQFRSVLFVVLISIVGVLSMTGTPCEDKEKNNCAAWKQAGACDVYKDRMRTYCAKTCDLCKPPAPPLPKVPDCAKTKFGCCWDNSTVAKGPTSSLPLSGCAPCLNKRSDTFCNRWIDDCKSPRQGQGDVMKASCPITCGVPCDTNLNLNSCNDHESLARCFAWSDDGKCTTNPTEMKVFCARTCKFC